MYLPGEAAPVAGVAHPLADAVVVVPRQHVLAVADAQVTVVLRHLAGHQADVVGLGSATFTAGLVNVRPWSAMRRFHGLRHATAASSRAAWSSAMISSTFVLSTLHAPRRPAPATASLAAPKRTSAGDGQQPRGRPAGAPGAVGDTLVVRDRHLVRPFPAPGQPRHSPPRRWLPRPPEGPEIRYTSVTVSGRAAPDDTHRAHGGRRRLWSCRAPALGLAFADRRPPRRRLDRRSTSCPAPDRVRAGRDAVLRARCGARCSHRVLAAGTPRRQLATQSTGTLRPP